MANADLKVTKVFIQDNKQVGYKVMIADGSTIDIPREQMIQAIRLGYSYSNATVSNSGVVRVNSSVPREGINAAKFNMISHSFNLDLDGGSFNLQVAKNSPVEISYKVRHRVIQGYPENFLRRRDLENLYYVNNTNYLRTFSDYYYRNRNEPAGYIVFTLGLLSKGKPSFWNKIYIIEFDYDIPQNLFKKKALSRYFITTLYNLFFKIIKDEYVPYECYKGCLDNFLSILHNYETTYTVFPYLGDIRPYELVGADAYHLGNMVCMDIKTYKDFYKICTEMEKLKK